MADKISDEQFKSEVLRFIEIASQKFDGLSVDMRTNVYKLERLENGLHRVEDKVEAVHSNLKALSGQFAFVTSKVITNDERLDNLKKRVDDLEATAR